MNEMPFAKEYLSILKVSTNIIFICFSGDKLFCITTPKFFSFIAIDIIFSLNLYVHEGLIVLFPIFNIWHFLSLNSISHVLLHSCLVYISFCSSSQSLWFLSFLVILHICKHTWNCLLLSCHLHILKTLLVPKLIPVVLHFLLASILIFYPLLLFSFPFLSGSLPSSSLMFLSIL